ncbi:hypothetical protein SEA_BAUER_36 [Arthrobacter phage Bauer]|uniref:Uncharacterized protein n=1 Tax=Arthrobacter phage Bauer TaxID=2985648 RepID=A0A9E8AAT3_9CAUD|nr:hypothetical protein QEO99_gp36 [Arthrobacter phage Bauer]UYM26585.1 hypothetical protein SEA_BAUER_36 [Arthrobacter phage Bauer]
MASIPDEAVEAAAKVLDPQTMGSGGALAEKFQEATRAEARAILEAAAPHLMAQAWEDGYHAALSDGYEYQTANPYRSEADRG